MDTYQEFFKAYYDDHKDFLLKFYKGPLKLTVENYYDQALQKTKIDLSDFDKIEKKIKLKFPIEFKRFFTTAYGYERHFQLPTMTLATAWHENPFAELNDLLFEQGLSKKMLKQKLIPIAFYQDNFYVCLDLRQPENEIDAPITYFDLDAGMLNQQPMLEEHVFPSFKKFIEHLTNCILTKTY
jgi:hypothetical protein